MPSASRDASPREQMLRRYFRTVPVPPTFQAETRMLLGGGALAVVAALFGFADTWVGGFLSVALLVGAGTLAYQGAIRILREKYRFQKSLQSVFPQPSDREVDRWFAEGLARIRTESLERLDLTHEECRDVDLDPIVGPVLWPIPGIALEDLVTKVGQDGMARFGVYSVTQLWLADEHLGIFSCEYDLLRDVRVNEISHEFFYKDIVAVTVRDESSALTLPTGQSLASRQQFWISVSNGSHFSMTVGADELRELTGAERIPENGTESAIRALRAKLRTKKAALPADQFS